MSSLDQIEISVEEPENRQLIQSIMMEVAALLEQHLQNGDHGEIDLKSLPLSTTDRTALDQALGTGEIMVQLNTLGVSEIRESRYPGVWRVVHRDGEERVIAELIEVADVPSIVRAERGEVERSVKRLKSDFSQ